MIKQFIKIILAFTPLFVWAQNSAEIVFPSAVEISPRSIITAFDVVETKNMDQDLAADLKSIQIGDSSTLKIDKKDLIKKLHQPNILNIARPPEIQL